MLQASICNNLTHVNQPIFFLLFAIDVVNVSFGFVFTQVFLDAPLQLAPDDAGDVEQSREYEEVEGDPLVVGVVQGGPVRDVKFDVGFPCGGWPRRRNLSKAIPSADRGGVGTVGGSARALEVPGQEKIGVHPTIGIQYFWPNVIVCES